MNSSRLHKAASPTVEPLESRIAPASILVGARGVAGFTDYDTVNADPKVPVFYNTLDAAGSVVTAAVGGTADTYYIKLKGGDTIEQFVTGAGFSPLLTITKGTVVAFFVDANANKQVDAGELSGVSTGVGASLTIHRDLDGSVLTNYNDKTNTISMTDLVGSKQTLAQLTTGGSITGSILAGGSISKVKVQGTVTDVATGLAANGKTFDLLRGAAGGDGTLAITAATGEAGGAITDITVRGVGSIVAGDGGVGGKGGAISTVRIESDNNGMIIKAGNGGAGALGKAGGVGGALTNVIVAGVEDSNPVGDLVQILAGNGGNTTGSKGGAGGALSKVYVGYEVGGSTIPQVSPTPQNDILQIAAGRGGDGKVGGAGGALNTVKVLSQVADQLAVTYEVAITGGAGGQPIDPAGGTSGAGGSVSIVDVSMQNRDLSTTAHVLVAGGDGGQTLVPNLNAKGAIGGSVSTVTFVGYAADIIGGKGSAGSTGGNGGSLTNVVFNPQENIIVNAVKLTAGVGGDGSNGAGGKGGDIKTLKIVDSNLSTLAVTAGAGGVGTKGKGGNGGLVTGLDIIDSPNGTGPELSGEFFLRSGTGGAGDKGGGTGGEISLVTFFSEDMGANVASGAGGNATLEGAGGAGGKLRSLNVTADGLFNFVQVNGTIQAGAGGNGAGKGAGGAGGEINVANINVDGTVTVESGAGGLGTAIGGGGIGGNLVGVGAFSRDLSGTLVAGNAGAGGKAAKGGSIVGTPSQLVALRAEESLTIRAGNGASGGEGGSITGVSFGSSFDSLSPSPSGNILINAGNGSTGAKVSGKGGSIKTVNGNPSSGLGTLTLVQAGNGADGATKASDGGSITDLVLTGVGDDFIDNNTVNIVVQSGDAGNTATGKAGAKGGDVKTVSISNLDASTTLRSVAAGNGGASAAAAGKGGLGGTIDGLYVVGGQDAVTGQKLNADIGYRSGAAFGYGSMGGIFAGAGGAGGAGGLAGLAGSVRNVSADSIAAIVAGRTDAPQAVEKVEKITLNSLNALKLTKNSPFVITYSDGVGGTASTQPLTLTDPLAVQTAINNLPAPAPATVTVTRSSTASFIITNTANGDIGNYTAEELLPGEVTERVSGGQVVPVREEIPGTLSTQESQSFKPLSSGTYVISFGLAASAPLAFNADQAAVQAAVSAVTAGAGDAVVTGTAATGYTVKFNANGDQISLGVDASLNEVQKLDVLGVGQFTITYNGQTTSRLAANASNAAVEAAIEGLLGGPQVSVTSDPTDATSYIVTFDTTGDEAPFLVTEYAPLTQTAVDGTAGTAEVQTLSFVTRPTFNPQEYANANLVGAIVDPNEIGSANFKFIPDPLAAPHVTFQLGDRPIDGLIIAKVLDQNTINFTPEASLVGGVFFDNDNKI